MLEVLFQLLRPQCFELPFKALRDLLDEGIYAKAAAMTDSKVMPKEEGKVLIEKLSEIDPRYGKDELEEEAIDAYDTTINVRAQIVSKTGRMRRSRQREAVAFNGFKSLFISDPDRAKEESAQISKYAPALSDQALVEELLRKKVTSTARLMEIFSTHPNVTKRLRALQMLEAPKREHMIR